VYIAQNKMAAINTIRFISFVRCNWVYNAIVAGC